MKTTDLTPLQDNISFIVGLVLAATMIILFIIWLIAIGLCEREEKRKTAEYLETLNPNDRLVVARYEDYRHKIKKNPLKKEKKDIE